MARVLLYCFSVNDERRQGSRGSGDLEDTMKLHELGIWTMAMAMSLGGVFLIIG